MTYKFKYIGIGLTMAAIFGTALSLFSYASANPSFFIRTTGTACGVVTATTSVTYMTPGTATTTIGPFDTSCAGAGSVDQATLLAQFVASSTSSSLAINYEYSEGGNGADCIVTPSSCDWYQSDFSDQATSTGNPTFNISTAQSFLWQFASSTQGFGQITNTNRQLKAVIVRTPTRYVRAIVTMPIGSFNGAVWAEFVGKRQSN